MKRLLSKKRDERRETKLIIMLFTFCVLLFSSNVFPQFTSGQDTLVVMTGDSTTLFFDEYDPSADTSGGTPYTGTAGFDLNGSILTGVDFDTTAAWTSAKFSIQTSETYNEDADTVGGTPYDWKLVNYEGDVYYFTPETGAINILDPKVIYSLKRYVRFVCNTSGGGYENEAAHRKMIPLLRRGF